MRRSNGAGLLTLLLSNACGSDPPTAPVATASTPLVWNEAAKLSPPGGMAVDGFGRSIDFDAGFLVVGAAGADEAATNSGAAYVFVRSDASWSEPQKLTASDGAFGDGLGGAVAIEGDTIFLGAPGDELALRQEEGSVYVFMRNGPTWVEKQKLSASDAISFDDFGAALGLDGDTLVIGAPGKGSGAVYVFLRNGTSWSEQQTLTGSDLGTGSDRFGEDLHLDGDTLIVGAAQNNELGTHSGAAYVFVRSGATWSEQQKLTASDATADALFGEGVSLEGDTAVIGAPVDDFAVGTGASYVFVRNGTTWTEQDKSLARDGQNFDRLGSSVSILGNLAIVGAPESDALGPTSGSAYIFWPWSGTDWAQLQRLNASDAANSAEFGVDVASGDGMTFIGEGRGSAVYVFHLLGQPCSDASQCASGSCVDGVCCDSACGLSNPSDCQACSRAAGAEQDGVCAPVAAASVVCRPWGHECDFEERCDGLNMHCPADVVAPDGIACGGGLCSSVGTCEAGVCDAEIFACDDETTGSTDDGIPKERGGCGCRTGRPSAPRSRLALLLIVLWVLKSRGRSRASRLTA